MSILTTPAPKSITLSKATLLTFHIAAHSHVLCSYMGIEVLTRPDDGVWEIAIVNPHPRPWLVPDRPGSDVYSLDSNKFAAKLRGCSAGEGHMIRWLLNIYNPGYAATKRAWHFDLFKSLDNLDQENREAIIWHLQNPVWP